MDFDISSISDFFTLLGLFRLLNDVHYSIAICDMNFVSRCSHFTARALL